MRRLTILLCLLASVSLSGQTITRLATTAIAGTMTTSGDVIRFPITPGLGYNTLGVEARGTWTGTVAIECAASTGGGAFVALTLTPRNSTTLVTSFTSNGQWSAPIGGCQRVQARATAAMTGTVTITMVGAFE